MNCPNDNETLVMSERSGIEIDYCPKCRGVWLDRGELDKIIEKNATVADVGPTPAQASQPIATPQVENIQHAPQEYRYSEDRRYDDKHYKKKHKRESFLGDLFDF
jgi:Zn-finger nucleic acid-binding protein